MSHTRSRGDDELVEVQLDLSKVHEGHQRRLEAEIAALHHAAEQAALEQAALERENEALAMQAHALQARS